MGESELEETLREMFRRQDAAAVAAGGGRTDLLTGARDRMAGARRRGMVGAAVAVAVATGGVGLAVATTGPGGGPSGPGGDPGDPPAAAGQRPELVHDWIWFSSRGLEIGIPGGWQINDYGCGMSDLPSAVRGPVPAEPCAEPEAPTKSLAIIATERDPAYAGLPRRELTVSGEPATLAEGRLPDGRYAAELSFPSLAVHLQVRTRDEPERADILRSAHLVDVDHFGCAADRPTVHRATGTSETFAPADPTHLAWVCYYGPDPNGRLVASAELDQPATANLARVMNDQPAGGKPDAPAGTCPDRTPHQPDAVVRYADPAGGPDTRIWVTFSGCVGRHMDNGTSRAAVDAALVHAIMDPILGSAPAPVGHQTLDLLYTNE